MRWCWILENIEIIHQYDIGSEWVQIFLKPAGVDVYIDDKAPGSKHLFKDYAHLGSMLTK